MGVYNSVYFNCPKCNTLLEEQFKPGSMSAWKFPDDLAKMPVSMVQNLNHTEVDCYECKHVFKVVVDVEIKVSNPRFETVDRKSEYDDSDDED